jgi:NADPH:quinone reductase-like Zn-dependent oxidoreductase
MRAMAIPAFGGPETIAPGDLPRPKPARGEVLVRVVAAGVNPVDWKVCEGRLARLPHAFPLIPGWDAAGVVDELGEGCQRFRKGDRVYTYARKPSLQWGTYAEYVAVPERHAALMPTNLLFEEAAAIPCAGLTAVQALGRAGIGAQATLLVMNGSGGVGHFALQLAKIAGARTVATTGPNNQEFVMTQGASAGVDVTRADWRDALHRELPEGADAVLDAVGGETTAEGLAFVKAGGVLVSVAGELDPELARARGVRYERISSESSGEQLGLLSSHAERKKLRPHVQTIRPLAEARAALEESRAGHVRGKLVLAL